MILGDEILNSELRKAKNLSDKHLMLFLLMNEWVKVKQANKSVSGYLLNRGYRRIAIYGMSYAGQRLYDELMDSDVEIIACIDQKGGGTYYNHGIVDAGKMPIDIDAIIVTPIFYFEEIKHSLEKSSTANIISLEQIIYELGESD